jgi:hypothetical protein
MAAVAICAGKGEGGGGGVEDMTAADTAGILGTGGTGVFDDDDKIKEALFRWS